MDGKSTRVSLIASSSGLVRWELLHGREHLVVPLVAMIGDEVFWPLGSKGPALVPADVLAAWPSIWNDTVVMLDHPKGATAAATPDYIEAFGLGRIYNARFENNRLQMEEWIDPERVSVVGGEAVDQFEALKSGKKIEVSFAPYVVDEYAPGVSASGKPYEYIWRLIVGCDHVANLPAGVIGACNNEMGCGAPMAAADQDPQNSSENDLQNPKTKGASMPSKFSLSAVFAKVKGLLQIPSVQSAAETEVGDLALWSKMWELLESTEPAFSRIEDIFHDSMRVVYSVRVPPFDAWEPVFGLFSRTFAVDDNGIITLTGEREPVVLAPRTYVPADGTSVDTEADIQASSCSCHKTAETIEATEETAATQPQPTQETEMTKEEIEAIVQTAMEEKIGPAITAAIASIPVVKPEDIAPLLAAAESQKTQNEAKKSDLVASLKAAQTQFSEDDLKAMDLPVLEKLEKALVPAQVDYRGRGIPRTPIAATSSVEKDLPPLPDPHGVNKFLGVKSATETGAETN